MATKIKTNTIDSRIDYIDNIVASVTGVDLREVAQNAILKREAMRRLGAEITGSVRFVGSDLVVARNKKFEIVH